MQAHPASHRLNTALAASGALLCAAGVGLSAYAAHAAQPDALRRLVPAVAMVLLHGVALAAMAPHARSRVERLALVAMLCGVLLFSGALLYAHALDTPARIAPAGGMLLIAAWLVQAVAFLRR